MIKKFTLFIIAIAGLSLLSNAQKIRLNGYANYVFDDQVDSYYSNTNYFNGTVKGGFQWGVGLEYRPSLAYGVELLYLRQDTKVPVDFYDYNVSNDRHAEIDLAINYIMVGGLRYAQKEKVEPYGGLMLGVGIIDASNPVTNTKGNATKFAWGMRAGVNIWTGDRVGIKLSTQLLSITQGSGGGIYFGTGGAGAGVTTYSSMLQFTLGGGLVFKLGN